jgi:16S rRNA (guanine(966)-N(2))-methyltransferase RsmD
LRQSLFDVLAPRLPGCRLLDAFAGSGAIGLEALSRGAARVVFVELRGPAVEAIRENLDRLRDAGRRARVVRSEVSAAIRALAREREEFDLVFLDPPYQSPLLEPTLLALAPLLAPHGLVIAEHFHKRELPETIGRLVKQRSLRVGDHRLSFYACREET